MVKRLAATNPLDLTDIEVKVAAFIGQGLSNQAIADKLCYAEGSVKEIAQRVYFKLGIHTGCRRVKLAVLIWQWKKHLNAQVAAQG